MCVILFQHRTIISLLFSLSLSVFVSHSFLSSVPVPTLERAVLLLKAEESVNSDDVASFLNAHQFTILHEEEVKVSPELKEEVLSLHCTPVHEMPTGACRLVLAEKASAIDSLTVSGGDE